MSRPLSYLFAAAGSRGPRTCDIDRCIVVVKLPAQAIAIREMQALRILEQIQQTFRLGGLIPGVAQPHDDVPLTPKVTITFEHVSFRAFEVVDDRCSIHSGTF